MHWFWRSITAHDVEEVQAIQDRDTLIGAAQDVEMRVVGHNMAGPANEGAGQVSRCRPDRLQ